MDDEFAGHPANHLGMKAVEALDRVLASDKCIAEGSRKTMALLIKHGLLIEDGEKLVINDRFGAVFAMTYRVPPEVEQQWLDYWIARDGQTALPHHSDEHQGA
jgi:hypothetical protein